MSHTQGGLGWMAANYLLGHIGSHGGGGAVDPKGYVGLIEVGGASAQVTQLASAAGARAAGMPAGYSFAFELGACFTSRARWSRDDGRSTQILATRAARRRRSHRGEGTFPPLSRALTSPVSLLVKSHSRS